MSTHTTASLPFDAATVEFDPLLRRLNLANTRRHWRELLQRAETHGWSCREFLGVLITEEIGHRQHTRVQRAVRQARFPFLKAIEEFDFSLQSSLRLPLLGSYLAPELVTGGLSLILKGKSGREQNPSGHRHRLPRHPTGVHRSLRDRRGAHRGAVFGVAAREAAGGARRLPAAARSGR